MKKIMVKISAVLMASATLFLLAACSNPTLMKGPSQEEADAIMYNGQFEEYFEYDSYTYTGKNFIAGEKYCEFYYDTAEHHEYADVINHVALPFNYDEQNELWISDDKYNISRDVEWHMDGTYYPDTKKDIYKDIYMDVDQISNDVIHVKAYSIADGTIYFDDDVMLGEYGAEFQFVTPWVAAGGIEKKLKNTVQISWSSYYIGDSFSAMSWHR